MKSIYLFIFILLIKFINTQYVDLSEMTDPRILANRHRLSSESINNNLQVAERVIYREIVFEKNNQPSNQFNNEINNQLDHKINNQLNQQSNQLEISNNECILNKESNNNELEIVDRECKRYDKSIDNEYVLDEQLVNYYKLNHEHRKKENEEIKMFNKCIKENKYLTEELVCYRNLKLIYTRYKAKINQIFERIKLEQLKIEIHPYSNELFILDGVFKSENCLLAVDNLEKVILRLDHLVSRIEPIDLTKEIIYGSIGLSILFCFYYVYKYMNVKYFVFITLGFIFYIHEYYYLLLSKRAEIQHQLRKLNDCQQQGIVTGFLSFLFKNFYSSWSFKRGECDINEDFLYVDAIFKINPLEPIFTIIPKLFSKSFVIIFEGCGTAFNLFASKLPILHVYPFLIILIVLIIYLIKMFYDFLIANRKLNLEFKLKLAEISNTTTSLMLEENVSLNLNSINNDSNSNNNILNSNNNLINTNENILTNKKLNNNTINRRFNNPINNKDKNNLNDNKFKSFKSKKLIRTTSLDFIPCF